MDRGPVLLLLAIRDDIFLRLLGNPSPLRRRATDN